MVVNVHEPKNYEVIYAYPLLKKFEVHYQMSFMMEVMNDKFSP